MCGIVLVVNGLEITSTPEGMTQEDIQEWFERVLLGGGMVRFKHHDTGQSCATVGDEFRTRLQARGPDMVSTTKVEPCSIDMLVLASLLQLRGSEPSCNPITDAQGNILAFNGEIYSGLEMETGENDAKALFAALIGRRQGWLICRPCETCVFVMNVGVTDVVDLMSGIRGPWSMLFWQHDTGTLWFGRDGIGRRSLLMKLPEEGDEQLVISSVSPESGKRRSAAWLEVPHGIYSLSIGHEVLGQERALSFQRHPWSDAIWSQIIPTDIVSTIVAQENEGQAMLDGSIPRYKGCEPSPLPAFSNLQDAASYILNALQEAVQVRCASMEWQSPSSSDQDPLLRPAPVLVLFSGGVDSTLLAALLHRCLPPDVPIDLANVSFAEETSPDRVSSISSVGELRQWAPQRVWRLIEVDSCLDEVDSLSEHLLSLLQPSSSIMDLNIGAPLWLAARGRGRIRMPSSLASLNEAGTTSMNENLDETALDVEYTSRARVVFMGHGADEQCCGYVRHRSRFREGGWAGLGRELNVELHRLWKRNLGRDDRLVSDHGREARFPFLDERVAHYFAHLPLHFFFNFDLPSGQGDKMVIRECLRTLGLTETAGRKKCAIQFGCRISKKSNCRVFGSNRAANKNNAGYVRLADVAQHERRVN